MNCEDTEAVAEFKKNHRVAADPDTISTRQIVAGTDSDRNSMTTGP